MVLPKTKRHLNEKKALSDNDSIYGHRNLNDTERSVIARHQKFNAPRKFVILHDGHELSLSVQTFGGKTMAIKRAIINLRQKFLSK